MVFVSVLGRKLTSFLNLKITIWRFKKVYNIIGIIENALLLQV